MEFHKGQQIIHITGQVQKVHYIFFPLKTRTILNDKKQDRLRIELCEKNPIFQQNICTIHIIMASNTLFLSLA